MVVEIVEVVEMVEVAVVATCISWLIPMRAFTSDHGGLRVHTSKSTQPSAHTSAPRSYGRPAASSGDM